MLGELKLPVLLLRYKSRSPRKLSLKARIEFHENKARALACEEARQEIEELEKAQNGSPATSAEEKYNTYVDNSVAVIKKRWKISMQSTEPVSLLE